MHFNTQPLVSGGYLVEGEDVTGAKGTTVLRSAKWDHVVALRQTTIAQEQFDLAVEEFFKPLTDAADNASKLVAGPANEWAEVSVGEEVKGQTPTTVTLDESGVLLRILAETDGSSLRWVGGSLVAVL